ncbi:MAG: hypothetical protein M1827_007084 [Pycnora praestabilis]|nr:MAG: hypothetical protein M1827_007084 [Pycnora praestabilis]
MPRERITTLSPLGLAWVSYTPEGEDERGRGKGWDYRRWISGCGGHVADVVLGLGDRETRAWSNHPHTIRAAEGMSAVSGSGAPVFSPTRGKGNSFGSSGQSGSGSGCSGNDGAGDSPIASTQDVIDAMMEDA